MGYWAQDLALRIGCCVLDGHFCRIWLGPHLGEEADGDSEVCVRRDNELFGGLWGGNPKECHAYAW